MSKNTPFYFTLPYKIDLILNRNIVTSSQEEDYNQKKIIEDYNQSFLNGLRLGFL